MEHLEGRQAVFAALEARQRKFDVILLKHGIHEESVRDILELAQAQNVPIRYVDSRELNAVSHAASHGGVVAFATPKPRWNVVQLADHLSRLTQPPLLLLLEGIEDARNLGFAIRSAEFLGATAVMIKKHVWDFDPVEVARPSSGAYERLPLVQVEEADELQLLRKRSISLIGCLAGVKRTIFDADLRTGCILAIGGEKRGLSGATRSICDLFVSIPGVAGPSSLSLSHSAAIVLAEAFRQRSTGGAS